MAKTRLLKSDREVIAADIIKHKFAPLLAAVAEAEYALAEEVLRWAYDAKTRKWIEAAPKEAFPTSSAVDVAVGGQKFRLRFGANYQTDTRRLFDSHHRGYLTFAAGDPLGERIREHVLHERDLKADRDKLRSVTDATLGQFRSFDDLHEAFPEAQSFIVKRWQTRPEFIANVPAVELRSLAAQLDLPPEIAEAA